MAKSRFTGILSLLTAGFVVHRTGPVLGDQTIALADGDYTIDELLTELQAKVIAADPSLANFTATVDAETGICSLDLGAAETGDLHWTASTDATEVRDWLRMTGATASLTDTPSTVNGTLGDRTHSFGFYPSRCLMTDREEEEPQGIQGVADDGSTQTLTGTTLRAHFVKFKFNGYPRKSGTAGEYEALRDFLEHAATGARFRHYPDRTITAAWVRLTAPYGYQTWVLARESWGWSPDPSKGNHYARFVSPELRLLEYV